MAETWRVVFDTGAVREVTVASDGTGRILTFDGEKRAFHPSNVAPACVAWFAALLNWPVREILAPGELSRAELAAAETDWRPYPPPAEAVAAHAESAPCAYGDRFGLWLARNGDVLFEAVALAVDEHDTVLASALNGDAPQVVYLTGAEVRPVGRNCEAMPHPAAGGP